jgi:putative acetyltransferase
VIRVALEDPAQPEVVAFLREAAAFSASLYPAESNHHLPLEALRAPGVLFHVARDASGRALGCGALKLHTGWAEVKSMWCDTAARGTGVGRALLAALEATAHAHRFALLRLETGIHNDAALRLYRAAGFADIPAFEGYAPDPLSVFLERRLP